MKINFPEKMFKAKPNYIAAVKDGRIAFRKYEMMLSLSMTRRITAALYNSL